MNLEGYKLETKTDFVRFLKRDSQWKKKLLEDANNFSQFQNWLNGLPVPQRKALNNVLDSYNNKKAVSLLKASIIRLLIPFQPINLNQHQIPLNEKRLRENFAILLGRILENWGHINANNIHLALFEFDFSLQGVELLYNDEDISFLKKVFFIPLSEYCTLHLQQAHLIKSPELKDFFKNSLHTVCQPKLEIDLLVQRFSEHKKNDYALFVGFRESIYAYFKAFEIEYDFDFEYENLVLDLPNILSKLNNKDNFYLLANEINEYALKQMANSTLFNYEQLSDMSKDYQKNGLFNALLSSENFLFKVLDSKTSYELKLLNFLHQSYPTKYKLEYSLEKTLEPYLHENKIEKKLVLDKGIYTLNLPNDIPNTKEFYQLLFSDAQSKIADETPLFTSKSTDEHVKNQFKQKLQSNNQFLYSSMLLLGLTLVGAFLYFQGADLNSFYQKKISNSSEVIAKIPSANRNQNSIIIPTNANAGESANWQAKDFEGMIFSGYLNNNTEKTFRIKFFNVQQVSENTITFNYNINYKQNRGVNINGNHELSGNINGKNPRISFDDFYIDQEKFSFISGNISRNNGKIIIQSNQNNLDWKMRSTIQINNQKS